MSRMIVASLAAGMLLLVVAGCGGSNSSNSSSNSSADCAALVVATGRTELNDLGAKVDVVDARAATLENLKLQPGQTAREFSVASIPRARKLATDYSGLLAEAQHMKRSLRGSMVPPTSTLWRLTILYLAAEAMKYAVIVANLEVFVQTGQPATATETAKFRAAWNAARLASQNERRAANAYNNQCPTP